MAIDVHEGFEVFDCAQRSPEWYALRCGLLTGSSAQHVIAERKRGTGELEKRSELRRRLVAERLINTCLDDLPFTPHDVQRGIDLEPMAFVAFEARTGLLAERVGFVRHATLKAGASPDGVVVSPEGTWDEGLELKCPKASTHVGYLQDGVLPEEYRGQCLHGLWLTGAARWSFCSYHPDFPAPHDLFLVRMVRDAQVIELYDKAVREFLASVDEAVAKLLGVAA